MTFTSYAQNFEDVRLWRAFSDVSQGRYLDIGTQDPVQDSVSLAFYEKGWRGVHVEPTPSYAEAMRRARPDELVIEAAVTEAIGPIEFFEIEGTGLSTGNRDIAERHSKAGWPLKIINVPTVTLSEIFQRIGENFIHWLKIDVEGMEKDVLASWGDHSARPAILVIEATAPLTQTPTHQSWIELVKNKGYKDVLFDGLSRYFVHSEHMKLADSLILSPNVFDGFAVSPLHFSAGDLRAERDSIIAEIEQAKMQAQEKVTLVTAELSEAQIKLESYASERDAALSMVGHAKEHNATLQHQLAVNQKVLDRVTDTFASRFDAAERSLFEARSALDQQYHKMTELSRELGQYEGKLAAQSEAHQNALSKAEEAAQHIVSELTDRLVKTDATLDAVRSEAARQLEHYHKSQLLESDRLAKRELELALCEAKVSDFEAETAKLAEHISDLQETQRNHAEAHNKALDTIRFQSEETENLRHELDQAKALANCREVQLREAASLLEGMVGTTRKWVERSTRWFVNPSHRRDAAHMQAKFDAIDLWLQNQKQNEMYFHAAQLEKPDDQGQSAYASVDQPARFYVKNEGPITSVPRLLAPHDVDFIQAAYQSLLGRAPDADGMAYYLQSLRAGAHKLTILKQLRRSPEGSAFIPGVAGLDRAIKRHQIGTLPIFGALVRLFTRAEGNSATHRQLRVIANDMGRVRAEQVLLINTIQQQIQAKSLVAIEAKTVAPEAPLQASLLATATTAPQLNMSPISEILDSKERSLLNDIRLFVLADGVAQ